jgi:hypothetical protein
MRIREHWPIARSRLRRREFAAVFASVRPRALGDMLEIGSGDSFLAALLAPLGSLLTTEYAPGEASHGRDLPRLRGSVTALLFARPSWWVELKRGVFPQVHGEYNGHVRELLGVRAKAWAKTFQQAGFEVRGRLRLPRCSGYGFGLERLRRVGERCGLGAHNAFIVTHPGAPVRAESHWPCALSASVHA